MNNEDAGVQTTKVAAYLRMSTDHQQYSIDNQLEYITKYAADRGMEIISTYNDEGKSGVSALGRNNFNRLIQDVVTKQIKIEAVLVYDVSRFGRWQDNDEAGYYSYLLKYHGVKIIYCAENLPDQSPEIQMLTLPALRYAAGAYSRNLSIKVFAGHVNLVRRGFFQGGNPGYGLRRKLVDSDRKDKFILKQGERKSLQTDRVILAPGTEGEIKTINKIFNLFIFKFYNEYLIAEKLNQDGLRYSDGTLWTRGRVHAVLINQRLIGDYIYNRTSTKLKSRKVNNPEESWVIHKNALPSIISVEKFHAAQKIICDRSIHLSDSEVLDYLKSRLSSCGKLSGFIIDEDISGPSSSVVAQRFGGLLRAYKLIGYTPERDYSFIEVNKAIRESNRREIAALQDKLQQHNQIFNDGDILVINNNLRISVVPSKCKTLQSGNLRWFVRLERSLTPDISIVMRMNAQNSAPTDYFILPKIETMEHQLTLKENNSFLIEMYRFDDLNPLLYLLSPLPTRVA
ncbi:recombinase family protein [Erwinia sp. S63]|uniref:recombinase family protein n=1 Tax=Erwinia sp. S63 TaxID=2769341 RepID=UPI00190BEA59|nr:recombinase family protein [Erwinia sp. S63]MBK0095033.1 recombinase family protein [Erwinia sp. S63]